METIRTSDFYEAAYCLALGFSPESITCRKVKSKARFQCCWFCLGTSGRKTPLSKLGEYGFVAQFHWVMRKQLGTGRTYTDGASHTSRYAGTILGDMLVVIG